MLSCRERDGELKGRREEGPCIRYCWKREREEEERFTSWTRMRREEYTRILWYSQYSLLPLSH